MWASGRHLPPEGAWRHIGTGGLGFGLRVAGSVGAVPGPMIAEVTAVLMRHHSLRAQIAS
jgi:hypothetical protein